MTKAATLTRRFFHNEASPLIGAASSMYLCIKCHGPREVVKNEGKYMVKLVCGHLATIGKACAEVING